METERNSRPIKNPEELQAFAQGYFSGEFPNPDRDGCLGMERIESLIQSATLPDTDLRMHLFNCSDCFSEYREARARHQRATRPQPTFRWRGAFFDFGMRPARGLVAAALFILVAGGGLTFYLLSRHSQSSPIMLLAPEPAPGAANAGADPATGLPAIPEPPIAAYSRPHDRVRPEPHSRGLRRPIETRIDLSEDVTRAAGGGRDPSGDNKIIELPPRLISVFFDLPDNSSKGFYAVTIVDPFGKPLINRKGWSRDGKTLKVFLDLRRLAEAKYRLCVSHLNEAPACYQILINSRS